MVEKKTETGKQIETRVKAWLKSKGHKATSVDTQKGDTPDDMLKMLCNETGANYEYIKKIIGGK